MPHLVVHLLYLCGNSDGVITPSPVQFVTDYSTMSEWPSIHNEHLVFTLYKETSKNPGLKNNDI